MSEPRIQRYGLISVTANICFALIKVTTGVLGNSFALIADGLESIADVFSSLLVWHGLTISGKDPDEDHPYGHGKAESLAGLFAAITLFISGGIIAYNAIGEILTPHHVPDAFTIPVVIAIIAGKELLYRFLVGKGKAYHSTALKADAWHHRFDSMTTIAVLIGIVIANIGGLKWAGSDDWAALLVVSIIFYNGVHLIRPSVDELMDRKIEGHRRDHILTISRQIAGVRNIEKLFIRKSGIQYIVEIHLEVDGDLTVTDGHEIAHTLKEQLLRSKELNITHVMTHVEPFRPEVD